MQESAHILLVEDDEALSRGISFTLQKEGFVVISSTSIKEARDSFNQHPIDLVLLDVGLPDGDGFSFCREIRRACDVFIVFLSAHDQEVDLVMGYDLGADDYITKPFSLILLISKINALLRRGTGFSVHNKLISKEIVFHPHTLKVLKRECEIVLTRTEIRLLRYFLDNAQQIITRERFLKELWDIEGDFIDDNTLTVHIRRLREKIEDNPSTPQYIKTIRGAGYIWAERCIAQ